ncbi:MAG: VanZ family protein [Gemmatimonadaceae bacterium]
MARRWTPSVLWGTLILVATSIPGSALPLASGFPGVDKLVHLFLYGMLGALIWRAQQQPLWSTFWWTVAGIALFAGLDEWHQQFVPGRSMELADWMADVSGATLGIVLLTVTALRRRETPT